MITDPPLHSPEARQDLLRQRLERGESLRLAGLAEEFGISTDSARRDLKALEAQGYGRCIRGGALPVARLSPPTLARLGEHVEARQRIVAATLPLIEDGMVLLLDGGTTVLALAHALPPLPQALVVTPAPAVAQVTLAKGIPTRMIGGRLSPGGAIAVGHDAVRQVEAIAADRAFLGACGLSLDFGLSSDDGDEAEVKRAMLDAAHETWIPTIAAKLGRTTRHHVAPLGRLTGLVTDAPEPQTRPYAQSPMKVLHV
ncbi:DeoR/GlpR family DNA-binding transcription regulator [Tropicibacter sp. S64]|uniref:DeoR/GlpR family DNA-binding transcription regulator n=1 Tax=Tropicibacter sp. S64 TaxID=3415122 RepID=UPI003C7BA0A6